MRRKKTKPIQGPIVVVVHGEEQCESHRFGAVSVYDIDLRRMEHDVTEEQAYEWAADHLLVALEYGRAGHQEVTLFIVNTVRNAIDGFVDLDVAMDLAAAQWRIDNA